MAVCPKCFYGLVLLEHRSKYKCALCSGLFSQKEIDDKEFREWNKRQRILAVEDYERERKENRAKIRSLKKDMKRLFNGLPKTPKVYRKEYYEKNKKKIRQLTMEWRLRNREYDLKRKQEYRIKNRELIKAKEKLRILNNPEQERRRQNRYRKKNRAIMRVYGMIQHYRRKQKALALQYLKNEEYKPSSAEISHSVPTISLSYLLFYSEGF